MVTVEEILEEATNVLQSSEWCQGGGGSISGDIKTCLLGDIYVAARNLGAYNTTVIDWYLKAEEYASEEDFIYADQWPDALSQVHVEAVRLVAKLLIDKGLSTGVTNDSGRTLKASEVCYRYNDETAKSKEDVVLILKEATELAHELSI